MKNAVKIIFIAIFPIMILSLVLTHFTRHVTLRETYYYFVSNYQMKVEDFTKEIKQARNVFTDLDFSLPNEDDLEDNNFLQNIWSYVKWVARVLVNFIYSIGTIALVLFRGLVFILDLLITSYRTLFFLFGLQF